MQCNFCGFSGTAVFEAKGLPVLDCRGCGHRFAGVATAESHADVHYSDDYFFGGGAGYADYTAEAKLLRRRGAMYADAISSYCRPGKMLDVGAAAGYVLQGFIDRGWDGRGLEPNAAMALRGRRYVGVDVRQGTFESFQSDERYELVAMVQVAAHFYDPKASFSKAYDLLKPGGCLLIETWDRSSRSARLLGRHWHEYSPPTVLHWYTKQWLNEHLSNAGFERIAGGRPPKRISGGHVRSLLKYRVGDVSLLNLIPESMEFTYPAEDLFWALFRKPASYDGLAHPPSLAK